jgi:hypothetical protein
MMNPMGRQSRSGTHEAEAELDGPSTRSAAELQAQIDGLRAQVAPLTRSGDELIATRTRLQSLLNRATDAIIRVDRGAAGHRQRRERRGCWGLFLSVSAAFK